MRRVRSILPVFILLIPLGACLSDVRGPRESGLARPDAAAGDAELEALREDADLRIASAAESPRVGEAAADHDHANCDHDHDHEHEHEHDAPAGGAR